MSAWPYLTQIPPNRQNPMTREEAFWEFGGFAGPPSNLAKTMGPPSHLAKPYAEAQADIPLPMSQLPYAPGVDPKAAAQKLTFNPSTGGSGSQTASGGGGSKAAGFDYLAALRDIQTQSDALAQKQAGAADPLRKQLEFFQQGNLQTDLSPLMALADQWTGSNLSRSYKNPETGQQRFNTINQIQSGISGAESGAEATKLNALKALAEGQFGYQKYQGDRAHQQAQLGLEREGMDLKRQALAVDMAKARQGTTRSFGNRILGEKAVNDYTELQGVVEMADNLEGRITQGAKLMGPVEGEKSRWPWAESHRKLQAEFDLVRQKIGKMVEGGVLRKEDEAKYLKILPAMTDVPTVAVDKARRFSALMRKDLSRYMENMNRAGYNVSGFADQTAQYQGSGSEEAPTELAVGDVFDGMTYLGGDPNQESSWREVAL
jgi:hypothetical protein